MAHFNRERIPDAWSTPKAAAPMASCGSPRTSASSPRPACSRRARRPRSSCDSPPCGGEMGSADTARDPRGFADQVLHRRGQLGHRRQQHAGLLHPRPAEVLRLHPHPEAPAPTTNLQRRQHAVGLLDAVAGIGAPGDVPVFRPRHPRPRGGTCTASARHTFLCQRRGRKVLGEVPLQDRAGHQELHRPRPPSCSAKIPTTTIRDLHTPSRAATTRVAVYVQIMPLRTRPTTASTRST